MAHIPNIFNKNLRCLLILICASAALCAQDVQADNMLAYQRAIGGWPKHINEVKLDYTKPLPDAQRAAIVADSLHRDATIDNGATVKEIRYLVAAYKKINNKRYLAAAEKGIRYLLKAQYPVGGWPQYYPDSSSYRGQITYNDNAMVNVLNLLMDVKLGMNGMDVIDNNYIQKTEDAIDRGIECILKTQVIVNSKPTVWCAQYNQKTLQPEMARKFEPASLSGSESVAIVQFLMRQQNPSMQIKAAINHAIDWFKKSKIVGYRFVEVADAKQPTGKDKVLVADSSSTIWARFYEIETNEPFFTGRDSLKKKKVSEIEHERRNGYAWYGTWPQKLLNQEYPKWLLKNI